MFIAKGLRPFGICSVKSCMAGFITTNQRNIMKRLIASIVLFAGLNLQAGVFEDVEKINKGTDGYIVGKALSDDQKVLMEKNGLQSDNPNVRKFLANDNLLIAVNTGNNRVLAINKRYDRIDPSVLKSVISELIHEHEEPTAMAHEKIVYWIFDADGRKFTEDDLKKWKEKIGKKSSGATTLADFVANGPDDSKVEFNPYLSVKLSSDQPFMTKQKEPKEANAYLMISSDKLITATTTAK